MLCRYGENGKACVVRGQDRRVVRGGVSAYEFLSGVRKEEEKKSIRIGISLYRGDDTFINNIRSIIEEKAKEYERESGIKVTLDIQEAKGSQNTQNNQVERFIALGCDVLCINPVDRMDTSLIIDKAMTAGCRWCSLTVSRWRRT